ncbi:MAG: NAD-dependent dihydropyrimidine dehydrogenase subunit PreA [Fervidicoccaceae archaeon]
MFRLPELRTTVASVEFANPFILGCGPPTRDAERIIRAAKMGWAGAVHKTVVIPPTKDPTPHIILRNIDGYPFINQNIELLTTYPVEQWEKWIKEIKTKAPSDFILISSIMGSPEPETWIEPLQRVQEAGTDFVELNVSCPHGSPEKYMGAYIGQNAELVGRIVATVKKYAKVPFSVKLTPIVTDIKPIALSAHTAGNDIFTIANTHGTGIIGIDIFKDEPLPSVKGLSTPGGLSGPAIKPTVLRLIHEVSEAVPGAEIFGLGGVVSWYDAVEHMMVGAKAVQLVTAVMWFGFGIINNLVDGMLNYMKERKFTSVEEIIGRVRSKIVPHSSLEFEQWGATFVDPEKCIACGKCLDPCKDAGGGALYYDSDAKVVRSNPKDCIGCGLCINLCPTGAIKLLPKEEAEKKYNESLLKPVPSLSSRLHKAYERDHVEPITKSLK